MLVWCEAKGRLQGLVTHFDNFRFFCQVKIIDLISITLQEGVALKPTSNPLSFGADRDSLNGHFGKYLQM